MNGVITVDTVWNVAVAQTVKIVMTALAVKV